MTNNKKIRLFRKQKNWSTKQLGDFLGFSGRTIENWEQNRNEVSRFALMQLEKNSVWKKIN